MPGALVPDRRVIFFTGASPGNYVLPMKADNIDLTSPTYFNGKYNILE
jgi:hypothetical protein